MPGTEISHEDVLAAREAWANTGGDKEAEFRAVLETTLRPGGLVARAVADALDDVAAGLVFRHDTTPGSAPSGQAAECADIAERVRVLAAEWREGKR